MGNEALTALRIIAALAWLIPLAILTPRAYRAIRGNVRGIRDLLEWAMAFLFVLFIGRWLLMPDDIVSFATLYALSIVCAGALGVVAWHDKSA